MAAAHTLSGGHQNAAGPWLSDAAITQAAAAAMSVSWRGAIGLDEWNILWLARSRGGGVWG